jgi:acetylglutamate kinase
MTPTYAEELQRYIEKANVLLEALPHIQKFRNETVVIKYGGAAMLDAQLKEMVMQDIVLLENIGINPIIVHGGGPEITLLMDLMGLQAQFVDGQRVTDAPTLDIAEMVLAGRLNGEIVSRLNQLGGHAVGLSGKDANLIIAHKMRMETNQDLGFVGEVTRINPEIISLLEKNNYIPVISPIVAAPDGQAYNINADTVAAEIAMALQARKLVLLTDVRGICRDAKDPATLINRIRAGEIEKLIEGGVVRGGMIPKVRACRNALGEGVGSAHILDGRLPHALLIELFTDKGIGTMITP